MTVLSRRREIYRELRLGSHDVILCNQELRLPASLASTLSECAGWVMDAAPDVASRRPGKEVAIEGVDGRNKPEF